MTFTQLSTPIPLISPRGKCLAIAVIDYGPEWSLIFVVAQDDTGECWCWANPQVRFQKNVTLGRVNISEIKT